MVLTAREMDNACLLERLDDHVKDDLSNMHTALIYVYYQCIVDMPRMRHRSSAHLRTRYKQGGKGFSRSHGICSCSPSSCAYSPCHDASPRDRDPSSRDGSGQ